jgi:hypothetical protein
VPRLGSDSARLRRCACHRGQVTIADGMVTRSVREGGISDVGRGLAKRCNKRLRRTLLEMRTDVGKAKA